MEDNCMLYHQSFHHEPKLTHEILYLMIFFITLDLNNKKYMYIKENAM